MLCELVHRRSTNVKVAQDIHKVRGREHAYKLALRGVPNRHRLDICSSNNSSSNNNTVAAAVVDRQPADRHTSSTSISNDWPLVHVVPCSTSAKNARLMGICTSKTTTLPLFLITS